MQLNNLELKIIENKPQQLVQGAVIWLHGLGADYNDFVPIVAELNLDVALKFIFPNAPIIPVTINNGYQMRAWYDILDFNNLQRKVDQAGIVQSIANIQQIIDGLVTQGIPQHKIVIAGFSQGGAISYYTALNQSKSLAGLLVLSSYLPEDNLIQTDLATQQQNLPILICHGTQDPVVNINLGKKASQILTTLGLNYEWQEYPMQHSVCYEEIIKIGQWLNRIFAN
jgi:phospholipase/carboxylesterase